MWPWLRWNSYFISIFVLGLAQQDGCYVCQLCLPDRHIFFRIYTLDHANPSPSLYFAPNPKTDATSACKLGDQKWAETIYIRLVVSDLQNYRNLINTSWPLDWHYKRRTLSKKWYKKWGCSGFIPTRHQQLGASSHTRNCHSWSLRSLGSEANSSGVHGLVECSWTELRYQDRWWEC